MTAVQHAVVPVEPTPEMLRAGFHADDLATAWAVMLAAAPAVQPAAGREEIARIIDPWPFGIVANIQHTERAAVEREKALAKSDRILAAISTPAQASGEPVAWRYRWKPTPRSQPGEWREPTNIRWGEEDRTGFEEQPLYAHPPAQASETGGEVMSALDEALIYIEKLGENIERNDVDMHLDAVERPFSFAQTMRSRFAALSAPQAAPGEGEGERDHD